jgi:hypothetical protein
MDERAQTRAEAEAQAFTLPARYDGWIEFAHLIDGYAVARDMGLGDLREWAQEPFREYEESNQWKVDTVLELRLLLFYKARQLRFSYELEFQTFPIVHSLLKALAEKTDQPYDDLQAEAHYAQEAASWATMTDEERMAKTGIRIVRPDADNKDV